MDLGPLSADVTAGGLSDSDSVYAADRSAGRSKPAVRIAAVTPDRFGDD